MGARVIFVSCGQATDEEKALGRRISSLIEEHGMRPFFAEDVHSPTDLNTTVFRAIQKCDGFFAVMQQRGEVTYEGYPVTQRASVWIHQEIAVLCYRMFLQGRHVPIRVYAERGIRLEGVMGTAIVNPIPFDEPSEVLEGLARWLRSAEFAADGVAARREDVFRRRTSRIGADEWLILELLAAHSRSPGTVVNGVNLNFDFDAIMREQGVPDRDVNARRDQARAQLLSLGLIKGTEDRTEGTRGFKIEEQWWDLVFDELRNVGRMPPPRS